MDVSSRVYSCTSSCLLILQITRVIINILLGERRAVDVVVTMSSHCMQHSFMNTTAQMKCYRVNAPYKPKDARLLSPLPLDTGGGLYKPNSSHACVLRLCCGVLCQRVLAEVVMTRCYMWGVDCGAR